MIIMIILILLSLTIQAANLYQTVIAKEGYYGDRSAVGAKIYQNDPDYPVKLVSEYANIGACYADANLVPDMATRTANCNYLFGKKSGSVRPEWTL